MCCVHVQCAGACHVFLSHLVQITHHAVDVTIYNSILATCKTFKLCSSMSGTTQQQVGLCGEHLGQDSKGAGGFVEKTCSLRKPPLGYHPSHTEMKKKDFKSSTRKMHKNDVD